MRTAVPEKLLAIVEDIDTHSSAVGPSRTKIGEIVRFMFTIEADEELNGEQSRQNFRWIATSLRSSR